MQPNTSAEMGICTQTEGRLDTQPVYFSRSVLRLFADSCDHTRFAFDKRKIPDAPRVTSTFNNGITTIYLLDVPTLKDLLTAATLIDEKKDEASTPLMRIARQFQDLSIYLSQHPLFQEEKYTELIITFSALGRVLETKAKDIYAPIPPQSRKHIQKQIITPPGTMLLDEYTDSLFLFFLGKQSILAKPKQDNKLQEDPAYSFYSNLYRRWRIRKGYLNPKEVTDIKKMADTQILQDTFDTWLTSHKDVIFALLMPCIASDDRTQNPRMQTAIDQIFEQVIGQQLDTALFNQGQRLIETRLASPDVSLLPHDLQHELSRIHVDIPADMNRLFMDVEKLLQAPEHYYQWIYNKVKLLCDVVHAYPFRITFKISKAVDIGEFECNLMSLVLASLCERFLGNDVVVLADDITGHMRLIVVEKMSLKTNFPSIYFVDPAKDDIFGPHFEDGMSDIQDSSFVQSLLTAYRRNPYQVRVRLELDTHVTKERYHSVGNWKEMITAGLWNNIGYGLAETIEDQRRCFKKAIDLDPKFAGAKLNLALNYSKEDPKLLTRETRNELVDLWLALLAVKRTDSNWVADIKNEIFAREQLRQLCAV